MQKFKTMSKLKLKTVQNGTEVENPNLMESGSYDYVDCSGYVIIGSGVYDNSGNFVDEGWIEVESGRTIVEIGVDPIFQVDVSWDSGDFALPLSTTLGPNGYAPCVTLYFEETNIVNNTHPIQSFPGATIFGVSPLCMRITIYYNILRGDAYIHDYDLGYLNIPFIYHAPQNPSS